jgi:hypothetical protein
MDINQISLNCELSSKPLQHFHLPNVYFTGFYYYSTHQTLLQVIIQRITILIVSFILLLFSFQCRYINTFSTTLRDISTMLTKCKRQNHYFQFMATIYFVYDWNLLILQLWQLFWCKKKIKFSFKMHNYHCFM